MKKSSIAMAVRGLLVIFIFVIVSIGYSGEAKANTSTDSAIAGTEVTVEPGEEKVDINEIINSLSGKELKDGADYELNDKYKAHVKITMKKAASSGIQLMSTTNSYVATCDIYIMHSGTNEHVATATHSVVITYNDSGLVHINSGSVSATTLVSYITGYTYGYSINNTDGNHSWASGMVRLYDSSSALYYYYGCGVAVYRSESPSFYFSQV